MATARDTVTRALRMINVTAAGETPSAEDASDGLQILNDMLHGWRLEGADLNHATMTLDSVHTTDDSFLEGIRYNLAVRMASEWGRPISPAHIVRAGDTFRAIQAATLAFEDDLKTDHGLDLRYTNRRGGSFNIDEG